MSLTAQNPRLYSYAGVVRKNYYFSDPLELLGIGNFPYFSILRGTIGVNMADHILKPNKWYLLHKQGPYMKMTALVDRTQSMDSNKFELDFSSMLDSKEKKPVVVEVSFVSLKGEPIYMNSHAEENKIKMELNPNTQKDNDRFIVTAGLIVP
mgnify:CR=1 FL=1